MALSPGGRYMAYLPSPSAAAAPHSPHIHGVRSSLAAFAEREKYLNGPFTAILPICYRLLSQEILRVTGLLENASVLGQSGLEHDSSLTSGGIVSNEGADFNGWPSRFQSERPSFQPPLSQNWPSTLGSSSGFIVKKTIRLDIPVDQYPNGKLSEASTECRVLIRGRGSIKDPAREEMIRGKPGFEHLTEPLHILIEAELPVEIVDARLIQDRDALQDLLKPVDESRDFFKKQQLLELAAINGTLCDERFSMSGSASPFNSSNLGMKRAKTRG